jgi:DNA replication factor Dna2.
VVDNSNNMIILHPDHLISTTVVADSVNCQRRAVLQDRIKSISDLGKPQVYGNIFHEVFQAALRANRWDLSWLRKTVEDILVSYVDSLYAIHMSMSEAFDYVMSKMPDLKAWADIFIRTKPTVRNPDVSSLLLPITNTGPD